MNVPLPWERLLWSGRPTLFLPHLHAGRERYALTDMRIVRLAAGGADELAGTENRLAVERMRYNERVQEYNTSRRRFPANMTAKLFGFKEHPFFTAPEEAKQVPKVNFSKPS